MPKGEQKQGTYEKTSPANYYTIQNWMTHECGLKYPQRDIYAILYGFTQDRTQWVEPTQNYIAELVGVSRKTVNLAIKELTDQGWLRKVTSIVPGRGTRSVYQTVTPEERKASGGGVTERNTGCEPGLQGVLPSVTGGVTERNTDIKTIINPISNTISTDTEASATPGGNSAKPSFPGRYSSPKKASSKEPEHTQGGVASASEALPFDGKIAAKAACVRKKNSEEPEEFQSFITQFYKPSKPELRRKSLRAWNNLIESGITAEDIIKAQANYEAMKSKEGVAQRYWANSYDFLTTWVEYDFPEESREETESGTSKLADPERVAALQARLRDKREYPESATCNYCGGKMYRKDESNKYHCSTPTCNYTKAVKPIRTA